MEYQKLFRSNSNKAIAGVCGGLGEFFAIDPVIVRLIFVILTILGGGGLLIYILLWIFVPYRYPSDSSAPKTNPEPAADAKEAEVKDSDFNPAESTDETCRTHSKGSVFGGIILITLGILFLADRFIPNINFGDLWPVILIIIGLLLLGGSFRNKRN